MIDVSSELSHFKPISLNEMDSVAFMDRTDTKFIFNSNRLADLLEKSKPFYRVLEIESARSLPYHSTYLDTVKFDLFHQHVNSRSNRFKIRFRTYEISGLSFLEMKHKTNKKRTIKHRIKTAPGVHALDDEGVRFVKRHLNETAHHLKPVLVNRFKRITLVGIDSKERITIDYELTFSDFFDGTVELPFLAIAELKREGFTNKSSFLTILKQMQIRQSSFSKYCIGSAILRKMPKINNLKPVFLNLNKLTNDSTSLYCL